MRAEAWMRVMEGIRWQLRQPDCQATEWERNFIATFNEGQLIAGRCTPKQVAVLEKIAKKLGAWN